MLIAARKTFSNDGLVSVPYMESSNKCVDAWFTVPCGIDTGGDFRIRMVCSVISFNNGNRGFLCGMQGKTRQPYFRFFQAIHQGANKWITDLGPTDGAGRISIPAERFARISDVYSIERTGSTMTLIRNGTESQYNDGKVPETTYTVSDLCLFFDAATAHRRRIYTITVWKDGKVVHDYSPLMIDGNPVWRDAVDGTTYSLNRQDRKGLFMVGETVAAKSAFAG